MSLLVPSPIRYPGLSALIGFSRVGLDPSENIPARNWGASAHDRAEGIHRPLVADAVVFQSLSGSGSPPQVLISLDLGWWRDRSEPEVLLRQLSHELNLPPECLLIALSHTHSGPGLQRDAPDSARFLDSLPAILSSLVRSALAKAEPAVLTWSRGRCDLATSRDLFSPEHGRHLTGYDPETPADDTILVGHAVSIASGTTLGVLVNYACHPTTLGPENRLLSPDFPGALRETVESRISGRPCVFLLGACGELAPAEQYVADPAIADSHGRRLGYAVLSTLEGQIPANESLTFTGLRESGAPLAVWKREAADVSQKLSVALKQIPFPLKKNLPSLQEIGEQLAAANLPAFTRERLVRERSLRSMFGAGEASTESIHAWRLGDALLMAHPFEAYSALQLQLRADFDPRPVVVLNIVNGYRGYLPPIDHYSRDQYSVDRTPFAPGGLELLIAEARDLLASLTP
jgi:hypothetical protein